MRRNTGRHLPYRPRALAAAALGHLLAATVAWGGQALEDTFTRQHLHGGAVAWQAPNTWSVADGRLVNTAKRRAEWLHEVASFYAPKPLGTGCILRVDIVHEQWTRVPGYVALRLADRETGAYIEWISHANSTDMAYRTSDTQPKMTALPGTCTWTAGQNATLAFQWQGIDAKTDKGTLRLLFAEKGGDRPALVPVLTVAVANLRSPDLTELVINARDHRIVAPLVAFDNFYVELSDGPNAPVGFRASTAKGQATLTWRHTPGAEAYVLQRGAPAPGVWDDCARLPARTVQYIDRQARRSVLYRYRLRAESAKGHSLWTPVAQIVLPGPPLAPDKAAARVRGSGLVDIAWHDNAVNERRFVIERQTQGDKAWQICHVAPANSRSAVDALPANAAAAARYRVCAVNEHGPSAWSNVAEAPRPARPPTIMSPTARTVVSAPDKLPVASVALVFDQAVVGKGKLAPADFAITAVKHPVHSIPLPSPKITAVAWDEKTRTATLRFAPAIPDLVEYRIGLKPTVRNEAGVAAAAPQVRIAVLLGDDDHDGFVAPAAGKRVGKRLAMPPMPIGIMGEDIEWEKAKGTNNVHQIIRLMDGYKGIDFFRINLWWELLEPNQGKFNATYIGFLRRLLAEAEKRQLPIEIGIRQERWPLWVCKHKGFSTLLYRPAPTKRLANTWRRLAAICHEYPTVFAYWPISEEYPAKTAAATYLPYLKTVTKALRAAHAGCIVKARPFAAPPQGGGALTPIVSQQGPQNVSMACGFYPTGASWTIRNPNPIAPACFNNLQVCRYYSSWVQGGPNGLGEIGFRIPRGAAYGDAERLLAFQRTMALAHDIGLTEFVIWGEAWTFDDPARYFPLLVAFRDQLVRHPRAPAGQFDLRLVNDNNLNFTRAPYRPAPNSNLSPTFRWLETRGYRFYLTTPDAMAHQKARANASLKLSELAGRPTATQTAHLHKALAGILPSGVVLPWTSTPGNRQSITGLPCGIEIEFPGANGLCDAVGLGPGRVQVYAREGTVVRWRNPHPNAPWHVLTTSADSRLTVLDVGTEPPH